MPPFRPYPSAHSTPFPHAGIVSADELMTIMPVDFPELDINDPTTAIA